MLFKGRLVISRKVLLLKISITSLVKGLILLISIELLLKLRLGTSTHFLLILLIQIKNPFLKVIPGFVSNVAGLAFGQSIESDAQGALGSQSPRNLSLGLSIGIGDNFGLVNNSVFWSLSFGLHGFEQSLFSPHDLNGRS